MEILNLLQINLRKIHLLPAFFAGAVKINIVAFDGTAEAQGCGFHYRINTWHGEIYDSTAFFADKVVMRGSIVIEMIRFVPYLQPQDFAGICQKIQVPVNGPKADIRYLSTHGGVNLVSCRMILPGRKICFYFFSLLTVFYCHRIPF